MEVLKKARKKIRRKTERFIGEFKSSVLINFEGIPMQFTTKNKLSKDWFYPRYLYGSPHEPATTQLIKKSLGDDEIFFDLGSHLGFFSVLAGKLSNNQVHAFEVDSRLIDLIFESLMLNFQDDINRFSVVNCAVSNTTGNFFGYNPDIPQNASTNEIHSGAESVKKAVSVSLDSYCKQCDVEPDLLKIDVEGAEGLVIEGAKKLIKRKKPKMIVEIHPRKIKQFGGTGSDLISKILSLGSYNLKTFDHRAEQLEMNKIEECSNKIENTKKPFVVYFSHNA